MLNLVQLQERLKDVPIQVLMQYANGMNTQIPPFLALGELNRRKKMQESAAADQAKEMAGAPSIKQQIEQAAGLLSLQGARQQAATQQAAAQQSSAEMPATNTTQSEPVQLAEGGMIDPVGERDFMGGGSVSPDMEEGIASIPLRNLFKRSDFAGGGIVAFAGKDESLVKYDPSRDEFKPDEPAGSMGEFLLNLLPSLPKLTSQKKYKDPVTGEILSYEEYMARARESDASARTPVKPAPADQARAGIPGRGLEQLPAAAVPKEGPRATRGIAGLPDAVQKYLGIDPDKLEAFKAPERETPEQYKKRMTGLNALFGVAEDPYAELKRRYSAIEEQDKRSRAEQPMDQLAKFLTGIAQSRRGAKFGEAGSAGVSAATELRAQQEALNRKQDLDMAALRSAMAEREDARARGDRDRFLVADKEVQEATRAIQKDKLNLIQNQGQMMNQARQVGASEMSAQAAMLNAMRDRSGESEAKRADVRVEKALKELGERPDYKLLLLSKKPEDLAKAEQMRQNAITQAIKGYEATGAAPSGGNRIRFDAQGNPIQ